ncbi:hypothetical protein GP486_001591 [Trichoglossum hirsutum]|uniref:Zn(2)-C6 fungal-type domain-containing protein n=1 Tax=Trichoglossum hirsutum TaxID=265104 RepID=A0A9P8RSJ7_9PEZI|nr:hypothetical protein GP486_001591 [Trichoglossum hirsutum]
MPGILPMKVIKIGSSSQQTRIAQACDRCRSKKIRCDGIRPCCSQCANVGFECKTSDKLSRRAFPRGYTESLEERVRQLEAEVRELKDLLDERDEKIEILSRIHSYSSYSPQQSSPRRPVSNSLSPKTIPETLKSETATPREDTFRVQESPYFQDGGESASYVMGSSSGRAFVDSFKRKAQETGKLNVDFSPESIFKVNEGNGWSQQNSRATSPVNMSAPPRVLSDQLITIYFQEWAPLFPILHRPAILTAYERYVAGEDQELLGNSHILAQLYLVFSIATLSGELRNQSSGDPPQQHTSSFEHGWRSSLDSIVMDGSMETLQCLLLAQIACILKADYTKLLHYKSLAVGISQRLGLHQSQKRFSLGALTSETRKRVFWCLYTLDCFSAAMLGLPKMIKESDVFAEYPANADDEYVTEKGFQATLPGEFTKISSALSLFRASRILSKVLETNYPAAASHELSLQKLQALEDELDAWRGGLPPHLRLEFVQDKPGTNVVNSRYVRKSLVYYYTRVLIHRPALGSTLGPKAAPSIVALADSSKHIIQIVELLEERNLSFSFCLNKNELLVLSGFGLLFQGLDLNRDGKLMKDNQKLLRSVVSVLERSSSIGAAELKKLSESMMPISKSPKAAPRKSLSEADCSSLVTGSKPANGRLPALASKFSPNNNEADTKSDSKHRRSTLHGSISETWANSPACSHHSASSIRSEPTYRNAGYQTPTQAMKHQLGSAQLNSLNGDYLPFSFDGINELPTASSRDGVAATEEWERIVGSIDNGQTNIYDNIYGGISVGALINMSLSSASTDPSGWSPDGDVWGSVSDVPTQSVHSLSEESLTSGEDLSSCDLTLPNANDDQYRGLLMPNVMGTDAFCLDNLDTNFGI